MLDALDHFEWCEGDGGVHVNIDALKMIQATLLRNQAFRETRSLGEQLSQINPTSDDYPQAAAAIVSPSGTCAAAIPSA